MFRSTCRDLGCCRVVIWLAAVCIEGGTHSMGPERTSRPAHTSTPADNLERQFSVSMCWLSLGAGAAGHPGESGAVSQPGAAGGSAGGRRGAARPGGAQPGPQGHLRHVRRLRDPAPPVCSAGEHPWASAKMLIGLRCGLFDTRTCCCFWLAARGGNRTGRPDFMV